MRNWLIIAMLAAVALSGCASEETPESIDDEADSPGGGDDGGDGGSTGDGEGGDGAAGDPEGNATGNATNGVPAVTLNADVVNGTAPLLVTFTLDVEDDSESLSWTFFVDGNETLPGSGSAATFNHTFDVGVFNASVVVDDGGHEVRETLTIEAVATVDEPAGPAQVEEGEFTSVVFGCTDPPAGTATGVASGTENDRFDLDATTPGGTFTVSFDSAGPGVKYAVFFFGEGGSDVGGIRTSDEADYGGDIPADATYARIGVCGGGETSYHYEGFAA